MSSSQDPLEDLRKEYKELKEKLKCSVCLELFKKPIKSLPCVHSFCSSCLDQHIAAASEKTRTSSSSSAPAIAGTSNQQEEETQQPTVEQNDSAPLSSVCSITTTSPGGFGSTTSTGGGFGSSSSSSSQTGPFGGSSTSSRFTTTSPRGFGSAASSPFGSTSTTSSGGFGSGATTGGFGFGATTGGFGSAASSPFGSSATTLSGGFGSGATAGGFGSTASTGGFGSSSSLSSQSGPFGGSSTSSGFAKPLTLGGSGFTPQSSLSKSLDGNKQSSNDETRVVNIGTPTNDTTFSSFSQNLPSIPKSKQIKGPIKCPLCTKVTEKYSDVKDNPHLQSELDRLQRLGKKIEKKLAIHVGSLTLEKCDLCDPPDQDDASVHCIDCKKNLCETCCKYHAKLLVNHKVVDVCEDISELEEDDESIHQARTAVKCESHLDNQIILFCINCDIPLCMTCFSDDAHKGHAIKSIENAVKQRRVDLADLTEKLKKRREDIIYSLDLVHQMLIHVEENLPAHKTVIAKAMSDLKEKIIRQIDLHEQKLITTLVENSNKKNEQLEQQRKELEMNQLTLENGLSFALSLVQHAPDDQFASEIKRIVDLFDRFQKDKSLLALPVVQKVDKLTISLEIDLERPLGNYILKEGLVDAVKKELVKFMHPLDFKRLVSRTVTLKSTEEVQGIRRGKGAFVNKICVSTFDFDKNRNIFVILDNQNRKIHFVDENFVHTNSVNFDLQFGVCSMTVDQSSNIILCDKEKHKIHVLDWDGELIRSFGSHGTGDGQLNHPQSVITNERNEIIVGDTSNKRIQFFSLEGVFIKKIGHQGAKGQVLFHSVVAISTTKDNKLLVLDAANNQLLLLDENETLVKSAQCRISNGSGGFGGSNLNCGIALDFFDNILISDYNNNQIYVNSPECDLVHSFSPQNGNPSKITVDNRNRIVVFSQSYPSQLSIFENPPLPAP